jgi:hypothetical protein
LVRLRLLSPNQGFTETITLPTHQHHLIKICIKGSAGGDCLDGHDVDVPVAQVAGVHGVELMRRPIVGAAEPVTLIAVGPLTNVALILRGHPEVAPHVRRIVVMGGPTDRGNTTPYGEFNIVTDPEAADILRWERVMVRDRLQSAGPPRGGVRQAIGILNLSLRDPPPDDAQRSRRTGTSGFEATGTRDDQRTSQDTATTSIGATPAYTQTLRLGIRLGIRFGWS